MARELKIILFVLACFFTFGPFVTTLIISGSVVDALVFVGQLWLLFFVIIGGLCAFAWVGSKIFRE